MAGGITLASLWSTLWEPKSENVTKQEVVSNSEDNKSNLAKTHHSRPFGRQESIHNLLGGGKSADVLLWRNKKISGGVLASATVTWVLLLWLNHNFISIVCFALMLGLLAQFFWSSSSGLFYSSPSEVPRVVISDELFIDVAKLVGSEVNRALNFLQNVACSGNIKQFLGVIASLITAAIIANWCNFLTLMYIGFVATQTLPILYEKYEDQIDNILYHTLDQLQKRFEVKKHE